MSTDTLERTDFELILEQQDDPDAPDKFRHYFGKEDLDRNLFDGAAIVAVCGFVKIGLAHPDSTSPLCEKCKLWYENRGDE